MNFENLQKWGGELHPAKTPEIKKDLLKERELEIENLLSTGNPEEAKKIVDELNEGNFRWEDAWQRKIMNHYYNNHENIPEAKDKILEIISQTRKKLSQEGRIGKFEKVFKTKYEGPRSSDAFIEDPKTPSDYFRNALYTNDTKRAEELLVKIRALGENDKTDQREGELFNYYIEKENFDGANQVIENMEANEHNQKYNSREGRINHLSNLLEE